MTDKDFDYEHYFDWAATTPPDQDILKESLEITMKNWGNPSSVHQIGKNAKSVLEETRAKVAKTLDVKTENIYFTSGGTESDQIPLLSVMTKPLCGTVLISSIEHPAIREQAYAMKHCGWKIKELPTDKYGIIQPQTVVDYLTDDTMLVCIMAVNNETGVIQPIYEIADTIIEVSKNKRRPKFHVDCVQAAGKIRLDLSHNGIDSAAISSHKICGPRGIGILYLKDKLEPFLKGGGQENNIRSGTENVFGAVAISKCLERYYNKDNSEFTKISQDFVNQLSQLKGCTIIPQSRLEKPELFSPFVVQAAFSKIPGNVMLRALDSEGFSISTGSACSSKKNNRPVLEAMHINNDLRETSVRFSFGPHTTQKAVLELFKIVSKINSTFNK
ncbi:MAG: cysteine desulfurase family protein [Spirochaetales bacterium]|nr:cysteine desulfurase family protein [Spirochaetales bacterium]MDY5915864.1 cysteine desulfurase family protein [Treponema sp.]